MATTADSASNSRSPRSSGFSGESLNSPQFPRNSRNLTSPWVHVVRGELESVPATPSSPASSPSIASQEQQISVSDCSTLMASPSLSSSDSTSVVEAQPDLSDNNGNSAVNRGKKPAWNKPSNGSIEVSPVMGAISWPALSDSTKASPKSSSDSSKAIPDGSVSVLQGPVIASSPQKQVSSNANPNSTPNQTIPIRQKSMKRGGGGGGGGPVNGGFTHPHPPPPPSPPKVEMQQNSSGKQGHVIPDSSLRDPPHKSNNWGSGPRGGFVSQLHNGNDHPQQQQRNSFRKGNGGSHMRGDGSYHNNHGGRRDHDRANHEWNPHRSFNGRDVHMQNQRVVQRNILRPPLLTTAPFISPPFGNPMVGFPDMTSPVYYVSPPPPESFRGVPFAHAGAFPMFVPSPDPQVVRTNIVLQIEYYFSYENLCRDTFLRSNMDEQGFVPVSVIANFNRVRQWTNDLQFILDAVRLSTIVEVQGDKIRKRNDWKTWLLPSPSQSSSARGPQSPGISNHDMLANRIESVGLEDGKTTNTSQSQTSGDLNSQSQTSSGEGQAKLHIKQVLGDEFQQED